LKKGKAITELVVISGKGGTGKTSITASFAALAAGRAVLADCDVDAADLHLVLTPEILERHDFVNGREAVIRADDCAGCGVCADLCRFDALRQVQCPSDKAIYEIDPVGCEGCGVCVRFCPSKAINFPDRLCGEWMLSETRCGPMVHACLYAAAENSGKLVATVRREARRIAEAKELSLIITDGPPGIGCPVIASLTGASKVLAVTEPTVSGVHDMERVMKLAAHFGVPAAVVVNKADLNAEQAGRIEAIALAHGSRVIGRIPFDRKVNDALMAGKTVIDHDPDGPAAQAIAAVWMQVRRLLQANGRGPGQGRQ